VSTTAKGDIMADMSDVAQRIREARQGAGMTQRQLAEASGVRQPNIAAYERGQRVPSAQMLARLLAATRTGPAVILAAHRDEVHRIAGRHHARDVRVFGSVARGTDRPDSDLDLLVTFDEDASLLDQAALIRELEDVLGLPVDVVSADALRERDEHIRAEAVPV
jgi:predicted nucleotidyltransferase